jgi:6-phosphogluconate dehydrogenase
MRIGFVGLGKMGSQIVSKLLAVGHEVVVYDNNIDAIDACIQKGALGANNRENLVEQLGSSPVVWLMIPADFVQSEVEAYCEILPKGSILIDGGNSNYQKSIERAQSASEYGVNFVDVGTSGGVLGLENGFSLMVGGERTCFEYIEPILQVLAQPKGGYSYMGPSGYGHYVKMIHNGIEYAIMQAYAEGYDLLKYGPLPSINLPAVSDVWQKGSIIDSTLNGLISNILINNPELEGIDGYVAASGEGQWTYEVAQKSNVAMPALKSALGVREDSQNGQVNYSTRLLAAMRNAFGGHNINKG